MVEEERVVRAMDFLGISLVATLVFAVVSACQPVDSEGEQPGLPPDNSAFEVPRWVSRWDPDTELVARVGDVGEPRAVGPQEGEPLAGISRDAGISVELSDGSVVWFFGDSAVFEPDGSMRFFEIGSAAWAAANDPFATLDYADRDAAQPFARAAPGSPDCPPEAPSAGMWPLSAALDPDGARDRVVVWMANICLGANRAAVGRGVSVGQWWYDRDDPPVRQPVQVEILEPLLFGLDGPRFGDAVLADGSGGAYVYGCDLPDPPGGPTSGPCRVGWVDLTRAHDPGAYRVWNGGDWIYGGEPAEIGFTSSEGGGGLPSGAFSVARDPGTGAVIMVYSPWPSYSPVAVARVAPTPVGPFGEPTEIELPGCSDDLHGRPRSCYAANVQPFLTRADQLGIGWYDQMLEPGDRGGTFLAASVRFEIEPAD